MYWQGYEDRVRHFYRKEERKARKEHKCVECREKIPAGTLYWHFVGKWDSNGRGSEFLAWDACLECEEGWTRLLQIFRDNGKREAMIIYGLLFEAVQDAFDAGYLKAQDSLVQAWLDIPESEEKISEERMALSQMKRYSCPLL